ncbi:MAG: hypothetical protein WA162_06260 [Thermodesulfobacteriota bacterium]
MEIVFDSQNPSAELSIILLDWSCRESFHTLEYLAKQNIARERYEVVWVEYYGRRAGWIETEIQKAVREGRRPPVDRWVVMGMPSGVCYHKHLMFNAGIIASKGAIAALCDSDAIIMPTFASSVIESFKEPGIVLHIDEVRNNDERFYPFKYPSVEDVIGKGCVNWNGRATTGLVDKEDQLHSLNYGACMAALRCDMIEAGGADEHMDYLGHICGPYELTFRLVNSGKKEVWHEKEFIYHVWHPGTDGRGNRMGPHDGRNVSTTAIEARRSGRIMPLVENQAIRKLRLSTDEILYEPLLAQAVPDEEIPLWRYASIKPKRGAAVTDGLMKHPLVNARLVYAFSKMLTKQFYMKAKKFSRNPRSTRDVWKKITRSFEFFVKMGQYNAYAFDRCRECIKEVANSGASDFAIYGTGEIAEVICVMAKGGTVKVRAVYDSVPDAKLLAFDVMPIEAVNGYKGKIIVASLIAADEKIETLKRLGVDKGRIVVL